ncbi:hypothetical protein [Phascolarctobacterium succinatutens]|uniref:hypothetical protein n=1 Tax=Phascolarctobacterium succinatutens TaxID=626940 RepID=UPI0023F2DCC9|nr:hypothetical protein [Phascolarctobacterium succinatutens]
MSNWNGLILTKKGRQLSAKVEAGAPLCITKIKLGDGKVGSGTQLEELNDLVHPMQIIGIAAKEVLDNGLCKLMATITNNDLQTGYYMTELGLYADDPDEGEILYAITTSSAADYLPAAGGATAVSESFSIYISITNADNLMVKIDAGALATMGYVELSISDHNNSSDAHASNLASNAETEAGTNQRKFVTPSAVAYAVSRWANYRLASTDYKVDDTVAVPYHADLQLRCTTKGTTSVESLDISNVTKGQILTDGGVTWLVEDSGAQPIENETIAEIVESEYVPTDDAIPLSNTDIDSVFSI